MEGKLHSRRGGIQCLRERELRGFKSEIAPKSNMMDLLCACTSTKEERESTGIVILCDAWFSALGEKI